MAVFLNVFKSGYMTNVSLYDDYHIWLFVYIKSFTYQTINLGCNPPIGKSVSSNK